MGARLDSPTHPLKPFLLEAPIFASRSGTRRGFSFPLRKDQCIIDPRYSFNSSWQLLSPGGGVSLLLAQNRRSGRPGVFANYVLLLRAVVPAADLFPG